MKIIKVLGTGYANCKTTLKLIEDAAKAKGTYLQFYYRRKLTIRSSFR